jgi:hypothetical protein
MLDLSLPKYEYLLRKHEGKLQIFDPVRKKYVVLTPEEWVRQHMINFLCVDKEIPYSLMSLESGLTYNRLLKRSDILIFDRHAKPLLLIECKASHVKLSDKTLQQLGTYNASIHAPFIGITNGLQHYYWHIDQKRIVKHSDLPTYTEMMDLTEK